MRATGSKTEELSAIAPKFDWGQTESYYMSIRLGLDGLSFCILDPVTNTYLLISSVLFGAPDNSFAKHEEYMLTHKAFGLNQKVIVSVESPAFSLMPISLFDQGAVREVLTLQGIKVQKNDQLIRNDIEQANASCVFCLPDFLFYFLKTQFAKLTILHDSTPLISAMLRKRVGDKIDSILSVCVSESYLTIVAARRGELLLTNRYYLSDITDKVYLILYVMSQLDFDHHSAAVVLHGDVTDGDLFMTSLARFVKNVSLASPPSFFNYAFNLPPRSHRFYNLFLMSLCV